MSDNDDSVLIDPVVDEVISEYVSDASERQVDVGEQSADELLDIATAVLDVQDNSVALEAYRRYAHSVIGRLDLGVQVGLESHTPADLADQCTKIALCVGASLEGYESYARFVFPFRSNLGKLKDVEKRLNIARKKLTQKIKRLEDETVKVNHSGMYWFLIYDGNNVDNPVGPLQESFGALTEIYEMVAKQFAVVFKEAIQGIKRCASDEDVLKFFEHMESQESPVVELYSWMKPRMSVSLMGNRRLVFDEKTNNSKVSTLVRGKLEKSWSMGGTLRLIKDEEPEVAGTYQIVNENDEVLFDLEAAANNTMHRAVKSFIPKSRISSSILNQMVDIGNKSVASARNAMDISGKAEASATEWRTEYNKALDHAAFSKDSKALLKKVNRMCDVTASCLDNVMSISIKQMIYLLGGTAALIDVSTDNVR